LIFFNILLIDNKYNLLFPVNFVNYLRGSGEIESLWDLYFAV